MTYYSFYIWQWLNERPTSHIAAIPSHNIQFKPCIGLKPINSDYAYSDGRSLNVKAIYTDQSGVKHATSVCSFGNNQHLLNSRDMAIRISSLLEKFKHYTQQQIDELDV